MKKHRKCKKIIMALFWEKTVEIISFIGIILSTVL